MMVEDDSDSDDEWTEEEGEEPIYCFPCGASSPAVPSSCSPADEDTASTTFSKSTEEFSSGEDSDSEGASSPFMKTLSALLVLGSSGDEPQPDVVTSTVGTTTTVKNIQTSTDTVL